MEVIKRAQAKALISQQSGETVFTWPRTQEEMDRMYSNKETLVVDGEEAVARVMGLLKEGTYNGGLTSRPQITLKGLCAGEELNT